MEWGHLRAASTHQFTPGKPVQPQKVVGGSMSLGGNMVPVENFAESLQIAFDGGAAKFQTGFYTDASDSVFKALGMG
jgi:ATP-dependent Lon protease